ncbi:MAG TPA: A/G-specific adenine glycosylase, partial [candidate division Zixibacteria bacterium]|nr:A/G-specific adenine glycosylase [candidate division Zixibacteria bacterium]
VARQPAFDGSDRAHRGAVLRALTAAPGHRLTRAGLQRHLPSAELDRLLPRLAADGLVSVADGVVELGS